MHVKETHTVEIFTEMSMNDETNWKPKETPVDLDKLTGASVSPYTCGVCVCVDHVQLENFEGD